MEILSEGQMIMVGERDLDLEKVTIERRKEVTARVELDMTNTREVTVDLIEEADPQEEEVLVGEEEIVKKAKELIDLIDLQIEDPKTGR